MITLVGPRQSGKTTLCQQVFPDHSYVSLEDPDIRLLADEDPKGFFSTYQGKLIIDEIQRVPKLLSYIQTIVDRDQIPGQFILTGSHQLQLSESISQSLAGRTALLTLYPLSIEELNEHENNLSKEALIFKGFYPALYKQNFEPTKYYKNYFQTYVERDVRLMSQIKNLAQFEIFLRLCAGRVGQLLNVNSLANEVGVNSNTIKHWLSILEASFLIYRLPPYFENIGKRLVKSPKLYFVDVGLAAYLLGIESEQQILRDPLRGNLFENLIVMELVKKRLNKGLDPSLYFYRDSNGNEIDIIYKLGHDLIPLEIKSSQTFHPSLLKGVNFFAKNFGDRVPKSYLVYDGENISYKDHKVIHYKNASMMFGDS